MGLTSSGSSPSSSKSSSFLDESFFFLGARFFFLASPASSSVIGSGTEATISAQKSSKAVSLIVRFLHASREHSFQLVHRNRLINGITHNPYALIFLLPRSWASLTQPSTTSFRNNSMALAAGFKKWNGSLRCSLPPSSGCRTCKRQLEFLELVCLHPRPLESIS